MSSVVFSQVAGSNHQVIEFRVVIDFGAMIAQQLGSIGVNGSIGMPAVQKFQGAQASQGAQTHHASYLKVYGPDKAGVQIDPADVAPADVDPAVCGINETNSQSQSLVELYDELLSVRDKERRVSEKTIRDNHSVLVKFQKWSRETGHLGNQAPVKLLEMNGILREFAEYMRNQPKGNSSAMTTKALGTITKLSNACELSGLIKRRSDRVSKSSVNLMRPRTEQQRRVKAVPVTVDELKAMLAVVDGCKWPKLGKVKPAVFWEVCLLSHYTYGFRSQDWFASRSSEKQGLLWSGIVDGAECPLIEGLTNDAGWAWYLVHKTSKKDEAAERPSDVLVPLSAKIRGLIEQFRGLDPVRVFPMVNNSSTYSREFLALLDRAGLSDEKRIEAGKPIVRLSLGQRNVASFRKGCAAYWSDKVSRPAASYLLHHSIAEEGVSKTTADSYLQNETILRKITEHIGSLDFE